MHRNFDKRSHRKVCFKFTFPLLMISSMAICSLVLLYGGALADANDEAVMKSTGTIDVYDLKVDVGDGDVVDPALEEPAEDRIRLYQYDPVEVGHTRYVEISPGRYVQMKTIAVKPPVFEIPKFLTPEECERIKELAQNSGLSSSGTLPMNISFSGIDETKVVFNATEWTQKLAKYDSNTDKRLDFNEVLLCLPGLGQGEIVPPDMLETMYLQVKLDLDSDGFINAKELWLIYLENKTMEIEEWLSRWRKGEVTKVKGKGRVRISEQAWIDWYNSKDHTVMNLQDRVTALTKLDRNIILSSENLQVVRYRPGGHYHAHQDSHEVKADEPCVHTLNVKTKQQVKFRICRFLTIIYYLQDSDGGGETAFPFAEFENISIEYKKNLDYNYIDLSRNCYKNLNVKPEYGKAIMWYNHHIDEETGWMSSLNKHALHGGCDVTKGTKWIANNWITVDDVYERQMEYQARLFQMRKDDETVESGSKTHGDDIESIPAFEEKEEDEKQSNDDATDQRNDNIISSKEKILTSSDIPESDDYLQKHNEL